MHAPWLLALALYSAAAEGTRARVSKLRPVKNEPDQAKPVSRVGTISCPPAPSLKMIADVAADYCYTKTCPKWNPEMNVCSYTCKKPVRTREQGTGLCPCHCDRRAGRFLRPRVPEKIFRKTRWRDLLAFVNAGHPFSSPRCARWRAFGDLWDEICLETHTASRTKYRRFPLFGGSVNSLGLTGNNSPKTTSTVS